MARWNPKNTLLRLWKSLVSAHIVVEQTTKAEIAKKNSKTIMIEFCDCCHDDFSVRDVRYTGVQFLCNKCGKETK